MSTEQIIKPVVAGDLPLASHEGPLSRDGFPHGSPDIVFVSLEPWDDVWRRNQFICAELARRQPDRKILFVEPVVDYSAALRRRRLDECRGAGTRPVHGLPAITATRPSKWMPNGIDRCRQLNEGVVRRSVRRAMRQVGIGADGRRPLLWLNPYYAQHMIGQMGEAGVIYDITDDWTQFGEDSPTRRRVGEQDRLLTNQADAVIVCSEALYASKHQVRSKLHLIKNGVDAAHYAKVSRTEAESTCPWEPPVFGYTGTVHRDRVDVDLVAAIASRMTSGTMVFLGPVHLSPQERRRLESTGRVKLPGPVSYQSLPDHMQHFDVCIVPHRVTPFTESLNPIKLWEYLAAGKPIVATPVAGFRDYSELVYLAKGPEAFLHATSAALEESSDLQCARQAVACQHSWQSRVDDVERVIGQVVATVGARS